MKNILSKVCIICFFVILVSTNVYAEETKLKLEDFTITTDLEVPAPYNEIELINTTILGTINFETDDKTFVTIDENSKVGYFILNKDTEIVNLGTINELTINKESKVLGSGTINKLHITIDSYIENNVLVSFDFSEGTQFVSNPEVYYKKHINQSTKNVVNTIYTINNAYFKIDDKSNYVDFITKYNGGLVYFVDGKIQGNGLKTVGEEQYFLKDGYAQIGWQNVDGKKIFFNNNGTRYTGTTGDKAFDKELDELLASIIKDAKTEDEKLKALYIWISKNMKWSSTYVPNNKGVYSQDRIVDMGQKAFDTRRGPCEYYASLYSLLHNRMGYPTKVIGGTRLSTVDGSWGDHTWISVNVDGTYYIFDPQYRSTYMKDKDVFAQFKITSEEAQKNHKWN